MLDLSITSPQFIMKTVKVLRNYFDNTLGRRLLRGENVEMAPARVKKLVKMKLVVEVLGTNVEMKAAKKSKKK